MYICCVCGCDKLEYPQYYDNGSPTFEICECCGFESGFDDLSEGLTITEYRNKWISDGAQWLNSNLKPENWNIHDQLKNLNRT